MKENKDEKSDLKCLKEEYGKLKKKHSLPDFEELNKEFSIEKISQNETDYPLREIRRFMADKYLNYLRFLESLLQPSNSPMVVFLISKTLGQTEKQKLSDIYKIIAEMEIELIGLDFGYDEKKEVDFINDSYEKWKDISKDFKNILEVIKKNWNNKTPLGSKSYFG